jgi:hypothetical protein
MIKEFEEMDWSKNYTYNDKKIYISYETKKYILCSFYESGKGMFKLDKTEFYA